MHSCCSLPSCCTQASSSRLVRCATTASSGPSVARSASRMSAVATSSRYRLLFTWSRMMLRAIVTSQAPDVAALEGQRVDPAQRPHERLAGDVLGRRPVADPVVDVPVDHRHVVVVELAERLGVALLGAAHQPPDVDALGSGTSLGGDVGSSASLGARGGRRPAPRCWRAGRGVGRRPGPGGDLRGRALRVQGVGHAGVRPPHRPAVPGPSSPGAPVGGQARVLRGCAPW